jgi:cytochrome P450
VSDSVLDIYDPDRYVDGPPHDAFERLRREDPVHRQEMPDGTWYWAVLRHADVVEVSRNPATYSAGRGGVTLEDLEPESLEMMQDMLLAMDPPRHARYRAGLSDHFRARVVAGLEPRIRAVCREILHGVPEGEVEAVHDLCAHVPSQVIGELVGIPPADRPRIHAWAERCVGGQDPALAADPGAADDSMTASIEMAMFAIDLAARRRDAPAEDLVTLLLGTEVDGEPMSDVAFGSFFVQLVVAGNDTSRTLLSSMLHVLLQHPAQLEEVRRDRSLVPGVVEEVLRWANPLHYFRRTAATDTELAGVPIAEGDKLAMVYTSANRDESVFEDPHRFDPHRDPNPHLSFGIGEHFCLGVHLARLEARVFLDELLDAWSSFELAGEPRRQRSNLNNSLKSLPLEVRRTAMTGAS